MMAVPGALIGILWMLAVTGTTINVESLMGAIMSVGISVSNSILVVSFANDVRVAPGPVGLRGGDRGRAHAAAAHPDDGDGHDPGHDSRWRWAWAKPASRTRRSGRAVIGGLMLATFATLFLVPIAYILLTQITARALHPRQALRGRDCAPKELNSHA